MASLFHSLSFSPVSLSLSLSLSLSHTQSLSHSLSLPPTLSLSFSLYNLEFRIECYNNNNSNNNNVYLSRGLHSARTLPGILHIRYRLSSTRYNYNLIFLYIEESLLQPVDDTPHSARVPNDPP